MITPNYLCPALHLAVIALALPFRKTSLPSLVRLHDTRRELEFTRHAKKRPSSNP